MNLSEVDRLAGYSDGFGPIAQALQWLGTLTKSPAVAWEPAQREAAERVLRDAKRVLYSDLLQLARDATQTHKGPPAERYLVPYNETLRDVDWDSLAEGAEPPYPLGEGWKWVRVLVYGAPGLHCLPKDLDTVFERASLGPILPALVTSEGAATVDLTRAMDARRGQQ